MDLPRVDGRVLVRAPIALASRAPGAPDTDGWVKLEGELARGGMGAVRSAFDATLQRRMAAKTMHASTYEHVMLVHGFLREAQVTGQLDHPNIVPIHELGRDAKGELAWAQPLAGWTDEKRAADWCDKQVKFDPDLWIVELDIADAPRLVAEWAALT